MSSVWQKPTIVLFDMDGTTVRHRDERILQWMERLDDFGFRWGARLGRFRKPAPPDLDENGFIGPPVKKPRLLAHRTLHKLRRRPVDEIVEPCANVDRVLEVLAQNGIPVGIVSNGLGKGYGHDVLTAFGLWDFFSAYVFREDITRSKPHPDPLIRALGQMRPIRPDDVIWVIGDRRKDILAALALAAHFPQATIVPMAYGWHAAVALIESGLPIDHIIIDYNDLADRLVALCHDSQRSDPLTTGS